MSNHGVINMWLSNFILWTLIGLAAVETLPGPRARLDIPLAELQSPDDTSDRYYVVPPLIRAKRLDETTSVKVNPAETTTEKVETDVKTTVDPNAKETVTKFVTTELPSAESTSVGSTSEEIPLPPPTEVYPNMPKHFPYPLMGVNTAPLPTKRRILH
ncbi:uncharacterized protein LOC131679642 [Topomyia yanbarensis]|uniref:uncharacterized protein LOC131679642 n=1 Tax=Topomyia yanbarensis TaxID=2498891 RepID=UPI00273B0B38|nr:uncharacterized protein LOC131679642 [Topomyia yanbarensis]